MKKLLIAFLSLSFLISCVSNKRTTYLQGSTSDEIYNLQHKTFKTQVNDILIIKVSSENQELTAFFNSLANSGQQTNGGININPYLSGYRIDSHGNIRLPYIGEMNVLGFSIDEIRVNIEKELAKYIQNTNSFFVEVKYAGIKYTILGQIGKPGTNYLMQYEANIIDAIANSGDITEYGNRTNVEVIRQEEGGLKKYEIDLTDINTFNSEVFLIKNNDIINVKPIKQKPIGVGTTGLSVFNTILSTFTVAVTTFLFINSL
ncbi:polysaccharide biosynthesis/export family protein [Wenyingzhuangia marina]|uniref:Protein involved in gliding motility EpsA n=1 Tax=Wenyingzhuangia marina TaxID=1195760 RepID=A0A1M5VJ35_9FLAO|nr:polysaccharide biosynthesis/export family protein [Wenyingzhuangia marina]GGF71852.1 sugar transporter [Wenyingzhuangia marina]SHH75269.1 protein involved in gliding motility EpsA [Wenyingzhuangia marina]